MKLRNALVLSCFAASAVLCEAQSTVLPPAKAAEETAGFLKDLIRIDTQDMPGNETKVATYLAAIFKREGIAYESPC
jgi:hypothetical protein